MTDLGTYERMVDLANVLGVRLDARDSDAVNLQNCVNAVHRLTAERNEQHADAARYQAERDDARARLEQVEANHARELWERDLVTERIRAERDAARAADVGKVIERLNHAQLKVYERETLVRVVELELPPKGGA